jgi:ethanolamine utilization protein EutN
MNLARVIGTLWATRKVETTEGATLQLIQPLTGELEPLGKPIVATDTVGAGPGETVLYVTAYEAVIPFVTRRGGRGLGTLTPTDASIVAIVERVDGPEKPPAPKTRRKP